MVFGNRGNRWITIKATELEINDVDQICEQTYE
jgi:hypothetical protein